MVVRANIVKNQTIGVDLNQKAGGFSAPVQSVNSKTGDVVLDANDVGADPEGTAEEKVSEHNIDTEAHNDIRMLTQKVRELIEEVATDKVNVSDIIDNLTTNVANKPLSAARGVALKNSIDGLQTAVNRIKVPTKVSELENDNKYLTAVPDEYITETEMNAKGYLTSVPSEYVTETELNAKGYLTQHQDLSGYAKKATTLAGYGITDAASKQELNSYGKVKTVNYMTPDANGNINVEGGSGKESNAFELIKSDTLVWNGNDDGKIIATNTIDPSLWYVCVSDVIPTLTELQKGGIWATTGADGIEYPEAFTSSNIVESGNLIKCCDGYILVAKVDGVRYVEGSDIDCTLPKAGVYFISFGDEGFTSKLTINEYNNFTKSILKMENLTLHAHDWYGKPTDKGNTLRGDDIIHGGLVKVSDVVPTLSEVQKGGKIRTYNVVNGEITGDLIIENYLENPYTIMNSNNEILIASDGIVMVKITNSGVYFRQDSNDCVHSLTIDGYTKFPYNVEKIPTELIPEGVGGGGGALDCDWNIMKNKPFEKTIQNLSFGSEYFEYAGVEDGVTTVIVTQDMPMVLGHKCTVTVNGVPHECNVFSAAPVFGTDDIIAITNGESLEQINSAPIQGIICLTQEVQEAMGNIGMFSLQGEYDENITISVEQVYTVIKTLDQEYLPTYDKAFRTYFYRNDDDEKMYMDKEFTILATMEDIKDAYEKGEIVVKTNPWECIATHVNVTTYPIMVGFRYGYDDDYILSIK